MKKEGLLPSRREVGDGGWRAHTSAAGDGWLRPSAEGGRSARWPAGRPKKRGARATWPGRRRRRGSAHLGLSEQGGWRLVGPVAKNQGNERKKIKDFLFLL
jgi:hypothetical protein